MEVLKSASDTLFVLLGAIMVLAMHAGFAFLELGTVRDSTSVSFYKNLMKGLDFKLSFKNEDKDGTKHWARGSEAISPRAEGNLVQDKLQHDK